MLVMTERLLVTLGANWMHPNTLTASGYIFRLTFRSLCYMLQCYKNMLQRDHTKVSLWFVDIGDKLKNPNAQWTLKMSAQLSGICECLHKLFPQVCSGLLCDFLYSSC